MYCSLLLMITVLDKLIMWSASSGGVYSCLILIDVFCGEGSELERAIYVCTCVGRWRLFAKSSILMQGCSTSFDGKRREQGSQYITRQSTMEIMLASG